jgi:hypothetical protein
MTKSVLPHDPSHADPPFEDEVRAMLTRRAADVLPTPAAPPAEPPSEPPGVVPLTVIGRPGRHGRRRVVAAAAAVLVLVTGVAAYAATRDPGAPTTETAAAQDTDAPIVWPLDDHVPADLLAFPDKTASAYLSEVVGGTGMVALQPSIVDGGTATVGYTLHGVHGEVALRLDGDRWGVTAATSDAARLDLAYAVDGNVVAELTLGPAARSGMRLHLTAVTDDGAPADDVVSRFDYVDGGEIAVTPPPPPDDGAAPPGGDDDQVVILPEDPGFDNQPMLAIFFDEVDTGGLAAVRLDALVDDDGDPATPDVVIGHATGAVESRDAPSGDTPIGASPTSTQVDPVIPSSVPTTVAPAPPAGNGADTAFEGTFRGDEQYRPTDGGCPDLDHVLTSTFALTDGTTWAFRAEYCGTIQGDTWTGGGTFAFTTPDADTLTGTFTSSASVTSDGEPYVLTITGGTGRHEGASGSCELDNHLTDTAPGVQEHDGSFSCEITAPTDG